MVKRVNYKALGDTKLKSLIEKAIMGIAEENNRERSGMYASDFGQCMRKVWYQFHPEKYSVDNLPARVYRIFHIGDDIHERLSMYLKRHEEIGFRDEVDVPRDELDVHGRCDGICTVDDQAVVVEFKSINRKKVYKPKDQHVGQITWYMHMFRKLRVNLMEDFGFKEGDIISEKDLVGVESLNGLTLEDLNDVEKWLMFTQGPIKGEIIYECKPNQSIYHFPIDYDENRAEKVELWYKQLKWHLDNDVRPNVKYNKDKFPCSWGSGDSAGQCAFYDYCYNDKEPKDVESDTRWDD